MNIAFVLKKFGGKEVDAAISTVLNLGNALEQLGHKVYIITERGFVKNDAKKLVRLSKHEVVRGLHVYRPYAFPQIKSRSFFNLPYVLERMFASSLGIRNVEKELGIQFDIIHSFGGAYLSVLTGYVAKLRSQNKNVKFMHTIKSYSLYDKYWFSPGSLTWSKFLSLADLVTVPTATMKKTLVKKGISKNKLNVVHSYVKLKNFYPMDKKEMREKYGFKGKKVLLYYGQWGEQKGIHDLIKASPVLAKRIKNFTLLLVCPNKLKPHNRALYEKYEKSGKLHLVEGVVTIREYINLADVVVLPYRTIKGTETNPLCMIESIACKTPVVSMKFSDIQDIFKHDKDVMLAKPHNQKSLVDILAKVFEDKKLQKRLTETAYPKVDKFDIGVVAKQFSSIYKKL